MNEPKKYEVVPPDGAQNPYWSGSRNPETFYGDDREDLEFDEVGEISYNQATRPMSAVTANIRPARIQSAKVTNNRKPGGLSHQRSAERL